MRGGGGALPLSLLLGGSFPVDVTDAPTLFVGGPRSVPSRISVVLFDGTMAGGTPGREDRDLRQRAGVTRLAGVSVGGGSAGSPHVGGGCHPLMSPGGSFRLCLLGGPPSWYCEPCWPRWPSCCR